VQTCRRDDDSDDTLHGNQPQLSRNARTLQPTCSFSRPCCECIADAVGECAVIPVIGRCASCTILVNDSCGCCDGFDGDDDVFQSGLTNDGSCRGVLRQIMAKWKFRQTYANTTVIASMATSSDNNNTAAKPRCRTCFCATPPLESDDDGTCRCGRCLPHGRRHHDICSYDALSSALTLLSAVAMVVVVLLATHAIVAAAIYAVEGCGKIAALQTVDDAGGRLCRPALASETHTSSHFLHRTSTSADGVHRGSIDAYNCNSTSSTPPHIALQRDDEFLLARLFRGCPNVAFVFSKHITRYTMLYPCICMLVCVVVASTRCSSFAVSIGKRCCARRSESTAHRSTNRDDE
jgi:hypothetical protein